MARAAAQIVFLAMLEVVLSPIWVWIAVDEQPGSVSLLGGAIIAGAILYQARVVLQRREG